VTDPHQQEGQTLNQMTLDTHTSRFRRSSVAASQFLDYLRTSEVGIWRVEQDRNPSRWWLNVTLPQHQQTVFDLQREIKVLFTDYTQVEPRTLAVVQERVREDMRVESDLAILVSNDPNAKNKARRRAGEMAIISIETAAFSGENQPHLHEHIAEAVATVDHYDVTTAIRDPSGFYGRTAEVESISADLKRAVSVGVFGLRKAGKTSLLNAVAALRRDEGGLVTVKIDVSEIVTAEQFRSIVLESLWSAVRDLPSNERFAPRLRTLTRSGARRVDLPDSATLWVQDIRNILEGLDSPAALIVDEIDQAFPARSNLEPSEARALYTALVQLRSLLQEQESLVLLCAGVDPALFERPLFDGKDNLLYKLVRLLWLAPMPREEMAAMVRSLGRRMGVRIRDFSTIDTLFAQFGGHPLLTRKACSIAVRTRTADSLPYHLTTELVNRAIETREYSGPRVEAADVLRSFTEWFPDESALLHLYFSRNADEAQVGQELLGEDPNALAHAIAYGLIFPDYRARIAAAIVALESAA
jgi:hypothetical protein